MFFISTDNKLYYRGDNRNGKGGLGHNDKVTEFTEVELENGILASNIVDFVELKKGSVILLNDGSVYISTY